MDRIPATFGLDAEQTAGLLTTAARAPSLHNTQPWRFRVTPTVIELYSDPDRRLPVVDPDGREMRIACGAALLNLRLALQGHGIRPLVTVLPDADRPDLIATVRHGGRKIPTPAVLQLLRAVPLRRTNRRPFTDVPVEAQDQYALKKAALDEGAWLQVVENVADRSRLQQLAVQAHQVQIADPAFTEELRRWTAVSPDRRDGVPAGAGGPRPAAQDRWTMRDFAGDSAPARLPGKDFESDPLIAVLTSHLSGERAEIQVGMALQRVLLTATARGLAVSFLSQVVEVTGFREQLRRLIGGTRPPQAVLRIGRGWPVAATPRRAVADLLMPEPAVSS
ncbi:Acg family FMN-binding oxidoreductase [Pseudonocardia sp. GCM10023141]|uniref:Acg family FMN-binding oxidoreductase n=1 Tax=Pseudonocardia sp. GCM10023141 TaxID=3252653 RepID=UPI00361A1DF2